MNHNDIRVYKYNEELEQYEVAIIPAFAKNCEGKINESVSIKYNLYKNNIYDTEDSTKPMELTYTVDDKMNNLITDKVPMIKEGILYPYMYVEYGKYLIYAKIMVTFAAIKSNYYKLIFKSLNNVQQIRYNEDETVRFPNLLEVQIPAFHDLILKYITYYTIPQTFDDVVKEYLDADVNELKEEFGNFYIDAFKEFVFGKITEEIEKMKKILGYTNNVHHKLVYDVIKKCLPVLNKRLIPYCEFANRKCEFEFDDATRKIKFTEH